MCKAACILLALVLAGRYAGKLLIVAEQPRPADAIFLLMGVAGERTLLCADLYKQGLAPRVILTNTANDYDQQLLLSKGIKPVFDTQYVRHILLNAGVAPEDITILPGPANITIDEGRSLAEYCLQHPGIRTVMVATSNYHTRRARWILSHQLKLRNLDVALVFPANAFSQYQPDAWWQKRGDVYTTFLEYFKIVYYWLWNRWFYP